MKMKAYGPRKWPRGSKVGARMFLKKNSERQHSSFNILAQNVNYKSLSFSCTFKGKMCENFT